MTNKQWGVLVALGVSAVAFAAADVLTPEFDPLREPVSRYVNGGAGRLTTVAILAIGLASAAVVRWLSHGPGRWVLAVWAGGVLVAAGFPADPPGQYANPSVSELVHGAAALVAFAVFPLAAMMVRRGWAALVSALATVVFAVFMVDVTDGPDLPPLLGLVERALILANMVWLAVVTVRGPATPGRRPRSRRSGSPSPSSDLRRS